MLVGLVVALVVLAIGFGVVERLWPARRQRRWREGMWTDLAYWFATPLLSRIATFAAFVGVAVTFALFAREPLDRAHIDALLHRDTWFTAQPRWLQALMALAIGDLVGYWMHRAFHGRRLWPFHAVHHSSVDLDWLSATRLHPVNEIVTRLAQALPLFALGFDPAIAAGFAPVAAVYAIGLHANVAWSFGPLRYVIASPTFHRWHHTSQAEGLDMNFGGILPVWDLIFGTFYMPKDRVPSEFGATPPVPAGIIRQLKYPFGVR